MPVSPADFYAYSQATGVQVPDSPEERAQLAPQVLQFRRNQLKQPQEQGIDPVSMGVGIGLALAGAGAGALALRGRNKIPKSTKTTGQSGVKIEDLNKDSVSRVANVGKSKEPTRQDVYQETVSEPVIQTDRADELIREYRQGIVDREIRREDRVRNKLDALYAKEGNKVIDQLRAEADEEGMAARRQRIVRNQQKEFDEARSYMSDVMESVIDEDIYETLPSSVINLAAKVQDPSLPLTTETVNNFNTWAQKTFANDPEVLSEINYNLERIPTNLLKQTPDTASQANEAAQAMAQNTLSNIQKQQAPTISDQQINAAGSGEDQMTGRVRQQLQRNEDLNLMEVDALEDVNQQMAPVSSDAPITQAAAQTVDGVPVDQAEGITTSRINRPLSESSAARFLARERDEIASELAEQGLPISPTRVEKELANRLGSDAYLYGSKYTRRKQNLQLGATYDPELFENMAKPFVVIAGEKVPTGRVAGVKTTTTPYTGTSITENVELGLRQPTYMEATAERLQEQAAKKRDWLGSVRLEEASKNAQANAELINVNRTYNNILDYKDEVLSSINSGRLTPEQSTRANQRLDDINYELDRLDVLSENLNQIVYGGQSGARVRGAEKFTKNYIADLIPPSQLKPGTEEGQRLYFEVDESGQPIPGTQELRSERKMVDMTPKGGGGRNVAEFSAGTRDEGGVDLGNILQELRTPRNQSAREYEKDQFGYRPGTGLTGKALEGKPFTDDRTQTGRVITRTGIQKSGPQEGSMAAAVNPYTQLDDETLGMISLQGSEADAANAALILARRRREGYDPSTVTGPGRSQRIVSSVSLTPEEKQTKISSMNVSQELAALQRSGRPDAQQQVQKYLRELRGGI